MKSISLTIAIILIIAMIVIIVGIYYGYNTLNNVIHAPFYSITIYNTQSIPTPSPFQQDIAICNGTLNIGSSFAYINNPKLFNLINSNGSNVYFATNPPNPNIYSWYEGQLSINNVTCDVWWINLPNGIPANNNVTIYMYIGKNSANYYQQYYPYVGASPQVISGYDNGQDVFIAYGYFNNTFDGWKGYIYNGSFSPTATSNGIEMLNNNPYEGTYILPPNNGNIPKIPLIVEEAWYYNTEYFGGGINAIALFGNTNNYIDMYMMNLPIYAAFVYMPYSEGTYLGSSIEEQPLNYTYFPLITSGVFYSYLLVNSSYAQTGYYIYNSNQVWAPLTLLDMYPLSYNSNYGNYTYYNLNYNPYQYGTLGISAEDVGTASYQYIEWVVARAYPPNGVMPSIYIS